MAGTPPVQIRDFYRRIQNSDTDALAQQPYYVDPRAFNNPVSPSPLLRLATLRNAAWQESYHAVQEAFFDFAGRCMYCANTKRHIHGMQASPVLEVVGFPGLYIYPKLLSNALVHRGLIDMLMHDQLADPATRTNLHEKYHVTYPEPSITKGEANTSFFDPAASQLKMQPRLEGSGDWTASPLTTRALLDKLRWFTVGDASADGSMPPKIRALVENILPIKAHSATAYVSSNQDPLELRQGHGDAGTFLDTSLGCDGVVVVGLEDSGERERGATSSEAHSVVDADCWRDLLVGSDSEDDEKAPDRQHVSEAGNRDDTITSTRNTPCLAAIHLRSTDALLFTGLSRRAWYGVAKVLPGSSPAFEQQWPCWPGTVERRGQDNWKGCMKGRRIDLVVG
ncbi:hypothetical protein LTR08_005237 [Meristemomyces frigidus]|nr:hypothetical protein LTR08_005237 [Meristemomyces frigidus]